MAFYVTSRKFYDVWTSTGGGGVNYFQGVTGDKITCVIEGYFKWSVENARLTFTASTKIISFANPYETQSFIKQGFQVDDDITITGTSSNDGNYTIVEVYDTYIEVAESIVNETAEAGYVYGVTPITAIDYYYNIIGNRETPTFESKTDRGTLQKYEATGLDATVATPVYAQVGTDSYGWVTELLTGTKVDTSDSCFIEGDGVTDYKQKFIITQTFIAAPLWTADLLNNFANRKAPDTFLNGNSMRHIAKIDGKFDANDPFIVHSAIATDTQGRAGWLNQSVTGQRPEYYIESIVYQNPSGDVIERPEATEVTDFTIVVRSRSDKFVNGTGEPNGTQFIVSIAQCPQDINEYIDTETTLLENLRIDTKKFENNASTYNGTNYGNDYQALTTLNAEYNDAGQITITGKIDYSAATKAWLLSKPDSDRYFVLTVCTQNVATTTTKGIDRVNMIADFNYNTYDTTDNTLFGLHDYFHVYPYPNTVANEANEVVGYEGDLVYARIPFWIETVSSGGVRPTAQSLKVQIVSTKTDSDDFILEEKEFDVATIRKYANKQIINIEDERGFILEDGSKWNYANLVRRSDLDTGTKAYFEVQYGFAIRYESWSEVVQEALLKEYDIANDIEEIVNAWKRYSTGNGWALKLRITCDMAGYDTDINRYYADTTFTILEDGDAPEAGSTFTASVQYFDEDNEEIAAISQSEKTRIVFKFFGDVTTFPSGYASHYGYMFVNTPFGDIFNRVMAHSETNSEADSPFSSADLPSNSATSSYSSDNMRLSYFANRIELDAWFDGSVFQEYASETLFVQGRIGYKKQLGIGDMVIGNSFIVS